MCQTKLFLVLRGWGNRSHKAAHLLCFLAVLRFIVLLYLFVSVKNSGFLILRFHYVTGSFSFQGRSSPARCFQQGRIPRGLRPASLRALLPARQGDLLRPGRPIRGAGQLPQAAALLHHVPLRPRAPLRLAGLGGHRRWRRRWRRQHEAQPHHPELHGAVLPQRLLQASTHEDFQLHSQLQEELLRLQAALTDSRLRPAGH